MAETEVQELEELVCDKKENILEEAKKSIRVELEPIEQLSRETTQEDLANLQSLATRVRAARITYEAVKQNKLPSIEPSRKIHPNENTSRQTRFVSTKKRRRPLKIKFAKPTSEEKELFMELPTWLNNSMHN